MKIEVDVGEIGLRLNIDGTVLVVEDKHSKNVIQLNLSESCTRVLKTILDNWK